MNIVMLLTNSFNPDVRVYKEAVYLLGQGHQVTILCWDREAQSSLPRKEKKDGIRILRFHIPSVAGSGYHQIGAYLKYVKACRGYLAKHQVDFVHCHDLDGMMAYKLSGKSGVPYVFDMHENYIIGGKIRKFISKRVVEHCIKGSRKSIAVLPVESVKVSSRLLHKIVTVRNYPDSSYLSYHEKTPSSIFRIGYHGCVRSQVPYFQALFEACKDMEDVRIDINGEGIDLPKLKEMEKAYPNVYVHGEYDGLKESNRLYQDTDLLFCGYNAKNPNYQGETEVVKFYEAIITGTPMIMTEGIGMADKVRKFGLGFVVDPEDADSIKEVVLKVLSHPEMLEECRRKMLDKADDYKWEHAVKVLDTIYQ